MQSNTVSSNGSEVASDLVDSRLVNAEAIPKHGIVNRRSGIEHRWSDLLQSRILAVETGKRQSRARTDVDLKMHKASREDEDVALIERGDEEAIGGGDESHVQRAFHDEEDLGGAGMRVRDVDAADGEVEAREPRAERVEPRERLHEHLRRSLPVAVVRVAGDVQAVVDEVVHGDRG